MPNFNKKIRFSHFNLLTFTFTRTHEPSFGATMILKDPKHVFYRRTRTRHLGRVRDTLWVRVSSNAMPVKSVVRNRARRRLMTAMHEVLEETGVTGEKDGEMGLTGTLQIMALAGVENAEWEELKSQARLVVEKMQMIGRGKSASVKHKLGRNGGQIHQEPSNIRPL